MQNQRYSLPESSSLHYEKIGNSSKINLTPQQKKNCHNKWMPSPTTTSTLLANIQPFLNTSNITQSIKAEKSTNHIAAKSIFYSCNKSRHNEIIEEEDEAVAAFNEEEPRHISFEWQEQQNHTNDFSLGSDNLFVTFDYGYSDSIEMHKPIENVEESEPLTFTIAAAAATAVEANRWWGSDIITSEQIWYADDADIATAFQVHRMQHDTIEKNDSTMMSFASYSSFPEYAVDSITH